MYIEMYGDENNINLSHDFHFRTRFSIRVNLKTIYCSLMKGFVQYRYIRRRSVHHVTDWEV